ncbi:MAG: hypothetical protein ABIW85_00025 [Variovorax sp.]
MTPSILRPRQWLLTACAAALAALVGCAQPAKAPDAAAPPAAASPTPSAPPVTPATAPPGVVALTSGRFLHYVNLSDSAVIVQMTLPDETACLALAGPMRDNWKTAMRSQLRPGVTEAEFDSVAALAIRCSAQNQSTALRFTGAFKTRINGMLIGLNAVTLDQCRQSLGNNSAAVEVIEICKPL